MPKSKEQLAQYARDYRRLNPGKVKARALVLRKANPIKYQVKEARSRAKLRSLEFDIRYEDVEQPRLCPVFGTVLAYTAGREGSHADDRATLDRVDSGKGYVKGNVRVISWRANMLKSNATLSELEAIVAYMKAHK